MKNPITPEGAASAQNPLPPVPTTKILAISHFMGTPMTPAQRAQIMPHEVHDTVNAYLAGKIDQWYFRTDGNGVVFIVNASTPEEAKNILEKFPLGQAGLMGFDYIPLVSCLGDPMTKSGDAGEDLIGCLGPDKWSRGLVCHGNVL